MRALAVFVACTYVACTFSFGASAHAVAIGHPTPRPIARAPMARPDHQFDSGGFSYFGTTAVGVYPSEYFDEAPVREEYFPDTYPQQAEPHFKNTTRAPPGPRILYIGGPPARQHNTVRVIYGTY